MREVRVKFKDLGRSIEFYQIQGYDVTVKDSKNNGEYILQLKERSCSNCAYAKRAEKYFTNSHPDYRCYRCGNKASRYYGANLNTDPDGNIGKMWPGCDKWTGKKVVV